MKNYMLPQNETFLERYMRRSAKQTEEERKFMVDMMFLNSYGFTATQLIQYVEKKAKEAEQKAEQKAEEKAKKAEQKAEEKAKKEAAIFNKAIRHLAKTSGWNNEEIAKNLGLEIEQVKQILTPAKAKKDQ